MSILSRVIGHGMGLFFIGLGLVFVVLGFNDGFNNWLDANSTCDSGSCSEASAKGTFLVVGFSFLAAGLITSVATEFAIRKTRRLMSHVSTFVASPADSTRALSDFLEPFGIDIDPTKNPNVSVQSHVVDLWSRRRGDVPTDPAGVNNYLKALGINLGESALANATVVDGGTVARQESPAAAPQTTSTFAGSADEAGKREIATIIRKRDRGETSGNQRLIEFELEVRPPGGVPYRVQVASLVRGSLAGLLIEGSTLNVRVDAHDSNAVTIDWSEN